MVKIHGRINEDQSNLNEEASIKNQVFVNSPRQEHVINEVQLNILSTKKKLNESINLETLKPVDEDNKLLFQRALGHKFEIPGSG